MNDQSNLKKMSWTGERYIPELNGSIELEHLHRYILASNLVVGKRVLDIACGEGYGTDLLAVHANYVIGVDVAEEAINHANKKYCRHNLNFKIGSAAEIPVESNSVDVVISFETIEHHDQHEKMMLEIKRVLLPKGLLVISSPNKLYYSILPKYSNPYHVKELFSEEFECLLKRFFTNVEMFGQRVTYGSVIVAQKLGIPFTSFTKEQSSEGLTKPVYDLAIASNTALPKLKSSLFEVPIEETDAAVYLTRKIVSLSQSVTDREAQINSLNQAIADREAQINSLNQAIADREVQINSLNQAIADRDSQILDFSRTVANIYSSRSWRFLAPIRWCSLWRLRISLLWRALPLASRQIGGYRQLGRYIFSTLKEDGVVGVRMMASRYLDKTPSSQMKIPEKSLEAVPITEDVNGSSNSEILFISHEASRTGAPIFLINIALLLKEQLGINCVFLLCAGGELENEFRAVGKTFVLAHRYDLDQKTLSHLKSHSIRFIYSNTGTNGKIQQRLKLLGCPILCHVHELGHSLEKVFSAENLRTMLSTTDYFFAGSGAVANYLIDQQGLPPEKVTIAHPFIDVKANLLAVQDCKSPLNLPPGSIVVGACGTIGWRKGTDLFIQVAKRVLAQTSKPVHFVWIGGSLTHNDYHNLYCDAEVMKIADHISFTGSVTNHLPYFNQFDIFLLSSREDPFPLVVLDAASMKTPIVCFDKSGGAKEIVEEDAGFIVPYMDVEEMANAVIRLAENDTLRQHLGEVAFTKVLARHDKSVGGQHIVYSIQTNLKLSLKEN